MKMKFNGAHLVSINRKGQILLVQRNDVPFWVIPGGKQQGKESPHRAAEREFTEETGMSTKAEILLAKYKVKNGYYKFLFSGKFKGGKFIENNEVRNWGWFDPTRLPKPISLYEINRIRDFLLFNGKPSNRKNEVNLLKEIANLARQPLLFLWVSYSYLKNHILGSRSFNIHSS